MSVSSWLVGGRRRTLETDLGSPWVPVAVTAEYEAPRARIDPDQSKSWLRRAMPIVLSHKATFIVALGMSFVGLVLQVQIPKILMQALVKSVVASAIQQAVAAGNVPANSAIAKQAA